MTWYGSDVADLGDEVIDLAYNPMEPRDSHGRWTRAGSAVAADAVRSAVKSSEWPYTDAMRPHPTVVRQLQSQEQLIRFSQKRILDALNTPPERMSSQQLKLASRVIESLTPTDYHQIRQATTKVVPAHIAKHVNNQVAGMAEGLMGEQNSDARRKLLSHLALILGALALSFITAGLGFPAGIAALIGVAPTLAQDYRDYRIERKTHPLVARAS